MLVQLIKQETLTQEQVIIDPTLVLRASTGPPARQ
jgi:DNA-binding LacI/PurR family transcriptional regulator